MHIHILGICGTFMGGIAVLAKSSGHSVSGSDANVYPPMSTQLEQQGIELTQGFSADTVPEGAASYVIGNALSRGNAAVEQILNKGLPYTSGAQWLAEYVLQDRWVLAVSGTHGKTSTSSMLAWILEYAGLKPGFLIGGVPNNFGVSARLGETPFFVVEADEYDTAFFDKRSKFVHYRPRTLIINNIEFDHADIFADLPAIQKQFHHLVRTVPGEGLIIENANDGNVADVLDMGCWTPTETVSVGEFPAQWQARKLKEDASQFEVYCHGELQGTVNWSQVGDHNLHNALSALAAARHAGVPIAQGCEALAEFKGIKRRLEVRGEVNGVTVYDDFAHHPTAIATTLQGLRRQDERRRILVVLEPRSNTMRMGVHEEALAPSLIGASRVWFYEPPDVGMDLGYIARTCHAAASVSDSVERIVEEVAAEAQSGDAVLVMSNGGFGGIHEKLLKAL